MIDYVPKPLTQEVNVTPGSPLKRLALLLIGLLGLVVAAYAVAGVLVDVLAGFVPASWERALGGIYAAQFPVNAEDPRTRRLQGLLGELTPYMDDEDARLEYSISVLESPEVNAVALPGGRIVVFGGLLRELESDEEVMFVLAHELGHFHHRDHLRRMGRGLVSMLFMAALSGSGGEHASGLASAINDGMHLAYSRSQERDADLYAVELLYRATGSTTGAEAFMRRLDHMEHDPALLYFFSTHPSPANRLEYVREAARDLQ